MYYAFQRTWKPFNPILGETYEMVNHNGITFLSEQVCSPFNFIIAEHMLVASAELHDVAILIIK